jgi:hypothetical protein
VPFGSCGWEYSNPATSIDLIAASQGSNEGFEWRSPICAPFVKPFGCDTTAAYYDNINPGEGRFLFRRHILNQLDHAVIAYCTVRVRGFVDVWCNGIEVLNYGGQQECLPVVFGGGVQESFLLQPGDNVFMLYHVASGPGPPPTYTTLGGYLDAQAVATEAVTEARRGTWGELKVIYR